MPLTRAICALWPCAVRCGLSLPRQHPRKPRVAVIYAACPSARHYRERLLIGYGFVLLADDATNATGLSERRKPRVGPSENSSWTRDYKLAVETICTICLATSERQPPHLSPVSGNGDDAICTFQMSPVSRKRKSVGVPVAPMHNDEVVLTGPRCSNMASSRSTVGSDDNTAVEPRPISRHLTAR